MLVLGRHVGETVYIGDDIIITIVAIAFDEANLDIVAPGKAIG
jgi:carbon storage regulator CsrA